MGRFRIIVSFFYFVVFYFLFLSFEVFEAEGGVDSEDADILV